MLLTRRGVLRGLAGGLALLSGRARAQSRCAFGAIRWDAQYCDIQGQPCFEEEQILGPSKWQSRSPLHARVTGPDTIRFEPSQVSFDAEIRAAHDGGLSYWAYLCYSDPRTASINLQHTMMRGLAYHRSSAVRGQVNIALIAPTNTLGRTGQFDLPVRLLAGLIGEGGYQTCLDGRPLLYVYYNEADIAGYWSGSLDNLKASLDALRMRCQQQRSGNPYVVVMIGQPDKAERVRVALGADAIAVYAGPVPSGPELPYAALAASIRAYWSKQLRAARAGMIPTVMIGWDTRPRKERPPSWEKTMKPNEGLDRYVRAPTPEEFAEECRQAVKLIDDNPQACAARTALIYAWNENSEGGSLAPSLGDPEGSRLRAAAPVIRF